MIDAGRRKQIHTRMIQIRAELDELIAEVAETDGEGEDPSPPRIVRRERRARRRWLRSVR